jgi:hypothetical protein
VWTSLGVLVAQFSGCSRRMRGPRHSAPQLNPIGAPPREPAFGCPHVTGRGVAEFTPEDVLEFTLPVLGAHRPTQLSSAEASALASKTDGRVLREFSCAGVPEFALVGAWGTWALQPTGVRLASILRVVADRGRQLEQREFTSVQVSKFTTWSGRNALSVRDPSHPYEPPWLCWVSWGGDGGGLLCRSPARRADCPSRWERRRRPGGGLEFTPMWCFRVHSRGGVVALRTSEEEGVHRLQSSSHSPRPAFGWKPIAVVSGFTLVRVCKFG